MVTLFPDGGNGDIPCGPSGRAHPYALIPSRVTCRSESFKGARSPSAQNPETSHPGIHPEKYSHLTMLFPTHITVTSYLEVEGPEWEAVGVTHGFLERGVASYANFAHQFHWPFSMMSVVSGLPRATPGVESFNTPLKRPTERKLVFSPYDHQASLECGVSSTSKQ